MSNNLKHEKMNVQITNKSKRGDNKFTILSRIYNGNSTNVGSYPSLELAQKCANDYLQIISMATTQPSAWNVITEIVIVGEKKNK